jgi:hypothetical protein
MPVRVFPTADPRIPAMAFEISRCKSCGAHFQPSKLACPQCGRPLPIVGAVVILAVVSVIRLLSQFL